MDKNVTQANIKDKLTSLIVLVVCVIAIYSYLFGKDNTKDDIDTMLKVAMENCDLESVKSLVKESKDSSYTVRRGIRYAARNGCIEIVEFFLGKKAGVNAINGALYYAVLGCQLEMVKFLLEKGADPNYRDWGGASVWMIAEDGAQYSWNTKVYREIADLLYEAEKNYKSEE